MRLLLGLCALVILVGIFLHPSRNAASQTPQAKPDPDELALRVTGRDVIAKCGQPQRHWKDSTGSGIYQTDTEHLWYAKVPAEILLIAYPHNSKLSPYWTFYGGSPSLKTNDMYDQGELAKRMPCVARWANIMAHALDSVPSK
jgi:hypothetical protein